jgi:hypothetical protein
VLITLNAFEDRLREKEKDTSVRRMLKEQNDYYRSRSTDKK